MGCLLDEASCLGVEERVRGRRGQRTAGSLETTDVVVGRQALVGGGACLVGDRPVDRRGGRHRSRYLVSIEARETEKKGLMREDCQLNMRVPTRCNGKESGGDNGLADVRIGGGRPKK